MNRLHSLLLRQASNFAPQVDSMTLGLLIFSGAILILIFGLIFIFSISYRGGAERSRKIEKKGELLLEFGWTIATLIIFMGFFVWGSVPFMKMHLPPADSVVIDVVGKQWMWKIQHSNGAREINELHVPLGENIILHMTSQDVIHSFFVPAFRIKQDVVPGRYTSLWFKATQVGEYHLFCTQYCGTLHADMSGRVIVMTPQDFATWLKTGFEKSGSKTMASRGREVFERLGCDSCHGANPGVQAPALYGIYGKPVGLSNGTTVVADENYLRESILYPGVKLVEGYKNLMPSFLGVANEEDVLSLIAYIKSLTGTPQGQAPEGAQ